MIEKLIQVRILKSKFKKVEKWQRYEKKEMVWYNKHIVSVITSPNFNLFEFRFEYQNPCKFFYHLQFLFWKIWKSADLFTIRTKQEQKYENYTVILRPYPKFTIRVFSIHLHNSVVLVSFTFLSILRWTQRCGSGWFLGGSGSCSSNKKNEFQILKIKKIK